MRKAALKQTVRVFFVISLVVAVVLAGCGAPEATPPPTPTEAPAAAPEATEPTPGVVEEEPTPEVVEPVVEEESELILGIAQDISNLDIRKLGSAASFSLLRHISQPLVWFDDNMQLYPVLAESWERIDDVTVRFKLREGVTFHNGQPMTAESVKWSLDQILDPEVPAWMRFAIAGVIEGATVIDDYTVDISTVEPTSSLLYRLTLLDILEPSNAGSEEIDRAPVGTGPYKFVELTPREHFILERNPDYWGDEPQIDRIVARIIPEAGTRLAALLTGEVQMINAVSPEALNRINAEDGVTYTSTPTTRHVFIALRNDRAPLDNMQVRQAMNYAVDREAIVATIIKDISAVATGIMAPSIPSARTDLGPYPYDPDKARELLEEAGYAGEEISFTVGRGRYPNDEQVAEAVHNYFQQVGLNVNFTVTEWATLNAEIQRGEEAEYDAYLIGWSASGLDPVLYLSALFHSEKASVRGYYANPEVDALLDTAGLSIDLDEVDELLSEAQAIMWDEAPYVFMYHPVEVLGISESLKNFNARPDEFFFFHNASLEE